MLRSAAKAILSKTVQTILSNYLLNIDITSISVTSLKGWEFELQNVKLRDGAILFRYSIKKKKKKKDDVVEEEEQKKGEENDLMDDDNDVYSNESSSSSRINDDNYNENKEGNIVEINEETMHDDDNNNGDNKNNDDNDKQDYESVGDNKSSGSISLPPTPPPASKICFWSYGTSDDNTGSTPTKKKEIETMVVDQQQKEEGIINNDTTNDKINENANSNDYKSTKEEDNEYEEHEVIVKIGKGGGIGDLSIQLENEKLYINIKDAFLVFNIDIMPPSSSNSSDNDNNNQDDKTKVEDTANTNIDDNDKKDIIETMHGVLSSLPYLSLDNCLVRVILSTDSTDKNNNNEHNDNDDNEKQQMDDDNNNDNDITFEIGIGLFSIDDSILTTTTINNNSEEVNDDEDNNDDNHLKLERSVSDLDTDRLKQQKKIHSLRRSFSDTTSVSSSSSTALTAENKNHTLSKKSSLINANDNDNYIYKHIYTGNTYATGIYMTILDTNQINDTNINSNNDNDWAYTIWKSATSLYFIHVSDFHFYSYCFNTTNTNNTNNKENTISTNITTISSSDNNSPKKHHSNNDGNVNNNMNDYYTIDSMLFGVDYIDTYYYSNHHQQQENQLVNDNDLNDTTTDKVEEDGNEEKNNKEYCYKSNYEKYKGMERVVTSDPLSNDIHSSWNMLNNKSNLESSSSTTSPSLILQVTINNPLEFNINQHTLEHIGIAIDCFSSSATANDNNTNTTATDDNDIKNDDKNNTLILFGIECSQLILRLQNTFNFPFVKTRKFNYRYGYYEMLFNQLILDFERTTNSCSATLFQDCIFVIQSIYLHQYKGIVYSNDLIALQYNNNSKDDDYNEDNIISTTASMNLNDLLSHDNNDTTITTTDFYKSLLLIDDNNIENDMIRANYALQLRFVQDATNRDNDDTNTTTITLKLASININAPYTMINNISQTINDCIQSLYRSKNTTTNNDDDNTTATDYDDNLSLSSFLSTTTTKSNKSKQQQEQETVSSSSKNSLQFHLNINQNGSIQFYPNISITYPFFQITGTTYLPYNGNYTIQSTLHQFSFQIQSSDNNTNQYYDNDFKLWNLPLDIRMRIFLFLDDITSLEQAFGIIGEQCKKRKKKKKRNSKNNKNIKDAADGIDNATTSTFLRFHLLNMKLSSFQSSIMSGSTAATTNSASNTITATKL